jgi:hypothetical protein|tara:strand:+ start:582 stop:728 length:147 start_codon:yes stop_codon:yes gene_type:complete
MGMELEEDDTITIDIENKSMKGRTTAKNWGEHMRKLKQTLGKNPPLTN